MENGKRERRADGVPTFGLMELNMLVKLKIVNIREEEPIVGLMEENLKEIGKMDKKVPIACALFFFQWWIV